MVSFFKKLLGGGPYYVRIRRNRLWVRDVATGQQFDDEPVVAVSRDEPRRVLAIGKSARVKASQGDQAFDLINGFDHPRTVIADFTLAGKALQHAFAGMVSGALLRPAPIVVLHVLEPLEGVLTEVELRALQELASGAGAREAHVWGGRELTDRELQEESFPGDHWLTPRPKWAKTTS